MLGGTADRSPPPTPLLEVRGLNVELPDANGDPVPVLRGVSFVIERGEALGMVGESGCGKSLTALALLGLMPESARVTAGRIRLDGEEILGLSESRMRAIRGRRLAYLPQEPTAALNPVWTVGFHLREAVRLHRRLRRGEAARRASELLERAGLPEPARILRAYPHQLSGGQCQRVLLALALAADPELLVADEPTAALDVRVQRRVLDRLDRLRLELGLAVLLISHDLAVVSGRCDRMVVMYAGEVVEDGPAARLVERSAHPYTRALLAVAPRQSQRLSGRLETVPGRVPEPGRLPGGCAFEPRCSESIAPCGLSRPGLFEAAPGHSSRCFLVETVADGTNRAADVES